MRKDKMAGGDKNGAEARSSSLFHFLRGEICANSVGSAEMGPPWWLLCMTCGFWNQGHVLGKAWVSPRALLKLFSAFTY